MFICHLGLGAVLVWCRANTLIKKYYKSRNIYMPVSNWDNLIFCKLYSSVIVETVEYLLFMIRICCQSCPPFPLKF